MTKSNGSMVWEILFDQYMAVKSSHFWDCKYTNGSKDLVATGRISPCATYALNFVSAVLCKRKNVISPGAISPSNVPVSLLPVMFLP